jgi:hypothetical protein
MDDSFTVGLMPKWLIALIICQFVLLDLLWIIYWHRKESKVRNRFPQFRGCKNYCKLTSMVISHSEDCGDSNVV